MQMLIILHLCFFGYWSLVTGKNLCQSKFGHSCLGGFGKRIYVDESYLPESSRQVEEEPSLQDYLNNGADLVSPHNLDDISNNDGYNRLLVYYLKNIDKLDKHRRN
ncbi:unnamed protein product [Gordionus sp. m RMFG-2023]